MKIDVLFTPVELSHQRIEGRVVVVIDVFRATSCIVTAMASGAWRLIPVISVDDAHAMREVLGDGEVVLLGGERHTRLIEGFDLDNSPFSYSPQRVAGATIVMSTTNGTRALRGAVDFGASEVLVGSIVNATAVARAAGSAGRDVAILCAGRKDLFTIEDSLCAGMLVSMIEAEHTAQMSDAAFAMKDFYDRYADNLRVPLRHCAHYNQIMDNGLADDVAYCLTPDLLDVVPRMSLTKGHITI